MKHKISPLPYFIIFLLILCGCLPKRPFINPPLPLRPDNIFLFEEGRSRFLEKQYPEATKVLKAYLTLYPLGLKRCEAEEILYKLGIALAKENLCEGINLFEGLLREEKIIYLRSLFLHRLGWLYFKEEDHQKAITTWQKGLKEDKKGQAHFLFSLGCGYYEENNLNQALSAWLKLYENYPEQELAKDALYRASLLFFDLRELSKAEHSLKEFIKKYSESLEAKRASFILGQIYLHMEEKEKELLYRQGLSFLREGEVKEAIKNFEEIVAGEDSVYREDAYYQLAFSYYLLSMEDVAKDYFQRLLREYPQSRWANSAGRWIKAIRN